MVKASKTSKRPSANAYHLNTMPYPLKHDVKLKMTMFWPSWENRLAIEGWAMSSKSS
jgi:hypothetical protein